MRDAASQGAEGGQLLGLAQLVAQALQGGTHGVVHMEGYLGGQRRLTGAAEGGVGSELMW